MIWYDTYEKLNYRIKTGDSSALQELLLRENTATQLPLLTKTGNPFIICVPDLLDRQIKIIDKCYLKVDLDNSNNYFVEEAYHSCTIEGAHTTIADTLRVFNTNKADNESEQMVLNTMNAIKYLQYTDIFRFDHYSVINLWKIITNNLVEGNSKGYRTVDVYVGNNNNIIFTPPSPKYLNKMMEDLEDFINNYDMHPIIKAIIIHFYFVYIHPFVDGNGRTARLFLTDYLIKNGYDKFSSISITSEVFKDLGDYYKTIKLAEDDVYNDITFFIVYYLNKIEAVLLRAREKFKPHRDLTKYQRNHLKVLEWLFKNEGRIATVKGVQKMLNIDEVSARSVLEDLVTDKFLLNNTGEYTLNKYRGMESF